MDEKQPSEANANVPVAVPDDQHTSIAKHTSTPPRSAAKSQANVSLLQSLTDNALNFFAHASNETLGACFLGLGATTYLVLGRVGLVIIGVAGGVVLHATWEGIRGDTRDEATRKADEERRREAGIDVAKRVLDWRETSRDQAALRDVKVHTSEVLEYSSLFGPDSVTALNIFTDAVIKDYVLYWYDYAIPGEKSFPASCRRTFMAFVLSLTAHIQTKRPADAFLDFTSNASSIIIVFLSELAQALNASPNSPAEDAISAYLKLKPDSSLSYMLDQGSQKKRLEDVAEDMLETYLDPKAYNCPPVHIFLKEVLAQLVLGYTVDMCSKPDWINDWIVYGLEESETTKEVMDIVDAGVEGRSNADMKKVADKLSQKQAEIQSKKEVPANETNASEAQHRRQMSKAESAMDEAMREAQRLTQLMIEEDRRRNDEEEKRRSTPTLAEDSSDGTTQGAPTPTSSQSGLERSTELSLSSVDSHTPVDERPPTPSAQFTSFDQLVPSSLPTALVDSPQKAPPRPQSATLTLVNANIVIHDDSQPGERTSIKAKPTDDYMVQIEPASSDFSGWMIFRKYADFETLHEVIRRISVITGVRFTEAHAELPKWKVHTKASLRTELERYLTDALRYQPLAESEGMKRFLEKERGMQKSPGAGKGFGWPTPDAFGKIGGDMMNVLTKAPKQVAGGGKAVFGGVAGLVGSNKKTSASQTNLTRSSTNTTSPTVAEPRVSTNERHSFFDPMTGTLMGSADARESIDSPRAPENEQRRDSNATMDSADYRPRPSASPSRPASIMSHADSMHVDASPASSIAQLPAKDVSLNEITNLPPPPSEMPADYDSPTSPNRNNGDTFQPVAANSRLSRSITSDELPPPQPPRPRPASIKPEIPPKKPLSEREASTAIELMFAVINELYTLSGAWQIRKTLLVAAKTFLLRPGNPQLLSIRDLLQTSLLDSNLSDSGLASHIYKLRENSLPTAEETEAWKRDYPEKTDEQKEELRVKARRLLVTKGMPQALTSVMGAAASGDALGKVFDCLQVPEVSRGLIFGLMLQALRVVTQ